MHFEAQNTGAGVAMHMVITSEQVAQLKGRLATSVERRVTMLQSANLERMVGSERKHNGAVDEVQLGKVPGRDLSMENASHTNM